MIQIHCQSLDAEASRSETPCIRQDVFFLRGQSREERKPTAGKSIRFLGTDVLLQVCTWNRCSEKRRDRTYRAHLRCLSSAVLRASFKESDWMGPVWEGEWGKQRVKTENMWVLSRVGRWPSKCAHGSHSVYFCADTMKCVLSWKKNRSWKVWLF